MQFSAVQSTIVLAGILSVAAGSVSGANVQTPPPAAPILQLVEGPGVLLADDRKLLFALYADGTVIYASAPATWTRTRHGGQQPAYYRAVLTPQDRDHLLSQLNPSELHDLKEREFEGCRSRVTTNPDGNGGTIEGCPTDQPWYVLTYRDGERTETINIEFGLDPGPFSNRDAVPSPVVRLWDALTKFSAGGEPWQPQQFVLSFETVKQSETSSKRRATIGCPWPQEWQDEFPRDEQLRAGRACRVVPATRREPTRDWIVRCWGLARPAKNRFVSVRARDLVPGEPLTWLDCRN